MKSSTATRIGAAVVIVAIIIGIGIGAYFLFFKKSEGSSPKEYKGTLYVNDGQGNVVLVDLNTGAQQVKVESEIFGITTFDYFKKKDTFYYGTTESNQPVLFSSGDSKLTKSKDWTKTAVAVDFGTSNKIYVVDGPDDKVYVLDLEDKYADEVLKNLEDPKDIVLNPYERIMFILQKNSILQASMDGSNLEEIVKEPDLEAIAINHERKEIFYATSNQVRSYSYKDKKEGNFSLKIFDDKSIVSLSSFENHLYLGVSCEDPLPDIIIIATLQPDNYVKLVQAPTVHPHFMQSIKLYDDKDVAPAENPCLSNNGDCHHLCLLSSNDNKYSCACQMGWSLKNDMKQCEKDN